MTPLATVSFVLSVLCAITLLGGSVVAAGFLLAGQLRRNLHLGEDDPTEVEVDRTVQAGDARAGLGYPREVEAASAAEPDPVLPERRRQHPRDLVPYGTTGVLLHRFCAANRHVACEDCAAKVGRPVRTVQ